MNHFAELLAEINARLDLPQPARSRVLLEIAGNMEDLYRAHLERGMPHEEAVREAVAECDLSDDALDSLTRIHCGPVRRVLDRLSARALRVWESVLLLVTVGAEVQVGGWLSRGDRVFRDAGPFTWPVALVAVVAMAVATAQVYRLFLKQDHRPLRLRSRVDLLLNLAVLMVFLGFAGTWFDVWRLSAEMAAGKLELTVALLRWALRSAALLQVSLGLGLLSALAWFGLTGEVSRIEKHEAELLLGGR